MRLQVGGVYEWGDPAGRSVQYVCLEECEAETVRFKKKEPGYKILCLSAVCGPGYAHWGFDPGEVFIIPRGAGITVRARRLD